MPPKFFQQQETVVPELLCKYFPPARVGVLVTRRLRMSQRQVVNDNLDFIPDVANLGSPQAIQALFEDSDYTKRLPPGVAQMVLQAIQNRPDLQDRMLRIAREALRTPDELGMLCLIADPESKEMWAAYADDGKGFVVEFNASRLLYPNDGVVGRVQYTDDSIESFLEGYGLNAFFRKRTQYAAEQEWRYVRALRDCESGGLDASGRSLYLFEFPPDAVARILVTPACTIRAEIDAAVNGWTTKPEVVVVDI